MPRKDPEAVRITTATPGRSDSVASRERRYLISMGVRTVSFVLAVVFAGTPLMWVFIAGAFVLPYVAVIAANVQADTDPDPLPDSAFSPERPELGPPPPA